MVRIAISDTMWAAGAGVISAVAPTILSKVPVGMVRQNASVIGDYGLAAYAIANKAMDFNLPDGTAADSLMDGAVAIASRRLTSYVLTKVLKLSPPAFHPEMMYGDVPAALEALPSVGVRYGASLGASHTTVI